MSKDLLRKRLNKLQKELTKPKNTCLGAIKKNGIIKWGDLKFTSMTAFNNAVAKTVIIKDNPDQPLILINKDHEDFEENRNKSLN